MTQPQPQLAPAADGTPSPSDDIRPIKITFRLNVSPKKAIALESAKLRVNGRTEQDMQQVRRQYADREHRLTPAQKGWEEVVLDRTFTQVVEAGYILHDVCLNVKDGRWVVLLDYRREDQTYEGEPLARFDLESQPDVVREILGELRHGMWLNSHVILFTDRETGETKALIMTMGFQGPRQGYYVNFVPDSVESFELVGS